MKLYELVSNKIKQKTINKSFNDDNGDEFLTRYGFTKIGMGAFSDVYEHKNYPYVIKIFAKDEGYEKFIDFCSKNKTNEHLPIFKGKKVKINNDLNVIRIEKLLHRDDYNSVLNKIQYQLRDNVFSDDVIKFINKYPNFIKTINEIKNLTTKNITMDIHSYNVLWRNDTPVIIDPLCGHNPLR